MMTEWDIDRALCFERVKALLPQPVPVDLRNAYNPAEATAGGVFYTSMGQ